METISYSEDEIGVRGQVRVTIDNISPIINCGAFPVKYVVGDTLTVSADMMVDSHDQLRGVLLVRPDGEEWQEMPMTCQANDRWVASFTLTEEGIYWYSVMGWVDLFGSWRHDLIRRPDSDPDLRVIYQTGARLIDLAVSSAQGADMDELVIARAALIGPLPDADKRVIALADRLQSLVFRYAKRDHGARYTPDLQVIVDRKRAGHGAWYEFFPRSVSPGRHGRLRDCGSKLQSIADMGFDVVYLPPIFPIGKSHRKGANNAPIATFDDVGSPWAIGSEAGGHKAIHPRLGTLADFSWFVQKAADCGLEVALDLAFQCSPDHPYVREHPEWFRRRLDGSIQYAENPPKKYQDIYPFDFESEHWQSLWLELKSIVDFWIAKGVKIFRVDNPHTKPIVFWQWLIRKVKKKHPDVLFLSEAFTRPKVMDILCKSGFTYSYTYFTWRNTKYELTQYFSELMSPAKRLYFRPHLWPNTPDILSQYLQFGGRTGFMVRIVLAATLSANYGIYGPAYEFMEARARGGDSEEYLDSEKYQLREWDAHRADDLVEFIKRLNRIRRENPALQQDGNLIFHDVSNENLICYSKTTKEQDDVILIVVNLDPHARQSGWVDWPVESLGKKYNSAIQMHDLLSDARYLWGDGRHFVDLDPHTAPAHIFLLRHRVRSESDFDYYI